MMIENDYDRGLMNGDQGVVLLVEQGTRHGAPTAMFAFPHQATLALFPAATLRGAVAVSYATTVHKAQGSELDQAALILPEIDLPLLSRELVYTARDPRPSVDRGRRAPRAARTGGRPAPRALVRSGRSACAARGALRRAIDER